MQIHKIIALGAFAVLLMPSSAVYAQGEAVSADSFLQDQTQQPVEANAPETDMEKSLAEAKAELEDEDILKKKVALATEMHKIRSTRDQVDSAVQRASLSLPEFERQSFVTSMRSVLNYHAIERVSIDKMVETYTLKELQSMVEYFSKPEAKSANLKVLVWMKDVQPEIIKMIDKAMIRVRTGQ